MSRHRSAEVVALSLVAPVSLKELQFCFCFHTFGDNAQPQASAHADDGSHDAGLIWLSRDLLDERLINLEGVDRKLPKVAQTGVPGAKVIDGHLDSLRPQRLENRLRGLGVLHENAFGQLQFKRAGIQAGIFQDCENAFEELLISELHRRDVYSDRSKRVTRVGPFPGLPT